MLVSEAALECITVAAVSRAYLLHARVCPDNLAGDDALIVAVAPGASLEEHAWRQIGSDEGLIIAELLAAHAGNVSAVAQVLGVDRSTVYRKMQRLGLCRQVRAQYRSRIAAALRGTRSITEDGVGVEWHSSNVN
jgi:DNA-binding NtrC family response regulator